MVIAMTADKKRKYKRRLKIVLAIAFLIWSLAHIGHFLVVDGCLDEGNVWDDKENRCRSDCFAIIKGKGCIYMDKEFQRVFWDCAKRTAQCDEKKLDEFVYKACKQYQGAWNKKDKSCYLYFQPEDCNKEPPNSDWEYPDICKQK